MKDPKSILDHAADMANDSFSHAVDLLKQGKTTAAYEAVELGKRLSGHARDIEDHDRVMDERHSVVSISASMPMGKELTTPEDAS